MSEREEYYARVEKIVGTHLNQRQIAVYNTPFVSKAIELLASCGALSFEFRNSTKVSETQAKIWGMGQGESFEFALTRHLADHNEFEDRWQFGFNVRRDSPLSHPAIVIGGGDFESAILACAEAFNKNAPAVIGMLLQGGTSFVSVINSWKEFWTLFDLEFTIYDNIEARYFDWIDLNNQVANIAKAVLLKGTEWERKDITGLLDKGKTTVFLHHPSWPWIARYFNIQDDADREWFQSAVQNAKPEPTRTNFSGKTVMIVGIGSLGSIVADHFRILWANIVGIDGAKVSLYNPVRQLYSTSDIGLFKAQALPEILALSTRGCNFEESEGEKTLLLKVYTNQFFAGIDGAIPDTLEGGKAFEGLLDEFRPDLVILTTAHPAEFRMAHILRKRDIPHIVGRCYPRARWHEITCIDGKNGPCFGCLQGHLYKGAPPTLTEEELARYEMENPDDPQILAAEPATRVDTSRAADTVVRLGAQLMSEGSERASWFRRIMEEERTCIIGGNHAEYSEEDEDWTFGVTSPGGAALYGVLNFIGSSTEETKQCLYCGRVHEVLIHRKNQIDLPDVDI